MDSQPRITSIVVSNEGSKQYTDLIAADGRIAQTFVRHVDIRQGDAVYWDPDGKAVAFKEICNSFGVPKHILEPSRGPAGEAFAAANGVKRRYTLYPRTWLGDLLYIGTWAATGAAIGAAGWQLWTHLNP